jgi:hypothetical protein
VYARSAGHRYSLKQTDRKRKRKKDSDKRQSQTQRHRERDSCKRDQKRPTTIAKETYER